MHRIRRRLKSFVWLALLAFGGLALAPTVSRAIHLGAALADLAGASVPAPMEAMAASMSHPHRGHDHSPPASEPSPKPAHHEHSLDHCAMCVVAAAACALAAPPPGLGVHGAAGDGVVAGTHRARRWRDDWSPASSRGPPATA